MKVSKVREHYAAQTAKASEVARALALAGLAVVWIFRSNGGTIPTLLFLPAGLFVLSLGLDLLQYMIAAWHWQTQVGLVAKRADDEDHDVPASVNVWPNRIHPFKAPLVLGGFAVLLAHVALALVDSGGKPKPHEAEPHKLECVPVKRAS